MVLPASIWAMMPMFLFFLFFILFFFLIFFFIYNFVFFFFFSGSGRGPDTAISVHLARDIQPCQRPAEVGCCQHGIALHRTAAGSRVRAADCGSRSGKLHDNVRTLIDQLCHAEITPRRKERSLQASQPLSALSTAAAVEGIRLAGGSARALGNHEGPPLRQR